MSITQDPAKGLAEVTPSDSTEIYARALYVGGAGDIAIQGRNDDGPVTLVGVLAGTILPIQAVRVYSTGTTATDIIALT